MTDDGQPRSYQLACRVSTENALVLTEPIKSQMRALFKRRSAKLAANPSVLDYLRMPVAKEKPRLCRT